MSELLEDTDGEPHTTITTDGSTFKPFVNAVRVVDSEARIQVGTDGLTTEIVDPANVFALTLNLYSSAFESYETNESVVGANFKTLRGLTRRARVNSDDQLALEFSDEWASAEVARGYENTDVVTNDGMRLHDPHSIRQEPDLPGRESIDFYTLEPSLDAFNDALRHVIGESDYVGFSSDNGDFVIQGHRRSNNSNDEYNEIDSNARLEGMGHDTDAQSLFSGAYLGDLLDILNAVKATHVEIHYTDEYPIYVDWDRMVDGNTVMNGTIMQAPRIEA